jgi:hypothetical protein
VGKEVKEMEKRDAASVLREVRDSVDKGEAIIPPSLGMKISDALSKDTPFTVTTMSRKMFDQTRRLQKNEHYLRILGWVNNDTGVLWGIVVESLRGLSFMSYLDLKERLAFEDVSGKPFKEKMENAEKKIKEITEKHPQIWLK